MLPGTTCSQVSRGAARQPCTTAAQDRLQFHYDLPTYGYTWIIERDGFRGRPLYPPRSSTSARSAGKSFKIKERYHAIVAVEAFNLFNHSNYGNFATVATSAPLTANGAINANAYGSPIASSGNPFEYQARSLQFIGRFSF